ncbi:hypothetical protein [Candidatus Leptofilum sp.]|uniref:hypothetical protein n=1 Tax=Candidatus Leptofilum sp. TaxID=3241576 RepID=UPI003B590D2B
MNFRHTMRQQLDKAVLFSLNRRVPDSLESSAAEAPTLEDVLAKTEVDRRQTAVYQLTAPGEHPVTLQTSMGEIHCRVKTRPAVDPNAPLLLFHHGFNEYPYTNSWQRLFPQAVPLPFHTVCIQAPFHHNWLEPVQKGFVSVQSVYQIFAGSLRLMELVQQQFEAEGATYTAAAGVSWGGITSMMYEGVMQQTQAVIPMLASPNLAQVIWDISDLFNRPMQLTQAELRQHLDFTTYYQQCAPNRVFPLLGESDLFFRMENHAELFAERPLVTIPAGHISAMWHTAPMRDHVLSVLHQLAAS